MEASKIKFGESSAIKLGHKEVTTKALIRVREGQNKEV
jgi:hypothetical protein